MYGSPQLGLLLLACHFFACLTVGFLFRFYKAGSKPTRQKSRYEKTGENPFITFKRKLLEGTGGSGTNIGTIIGDSVKNSVGTIIAIGGFIVLFSVIISLLTETGIIGAASDLFAAVLFPLGLDTNVIKGILSGFFEITTGSNLISSISELPLAVKLPAASLIIGWAGLSVHFQVFSIASKTDISIRPYLIGKMLQGVISALYTWLFLRSFHFEMSVREPVLGSSMPTTASWLKIFGSSLLTLSILLCVFAFFTIICRRTAENKTRLKRHH